MSVPADALLPHPDGVAPPLEVEVGVLLPAPVDVFSLLTHNLSPEPEQISVEVKAYDINSLFQLFLRESACMKDEGVRSTLLAIYTFKTLL